MSEYGPGNRWIIVRDIKADSGGSMAVITSDAYRAPCLEHNPDIPVYSRAELDMIKSARHSAALFRNVQMVKRVFRKSRVVDVILGTEE